MSLRCRYVFSARLQGQSGRWTADFHCLPQREPSWAPSRLQFVRGVLCPTFATLVRVSPERREFRLVTLLWIGWNVSIESLVQEVFQHEVVKCLLQRSLSLESQRATSAKTPAAPVGRVSWVLVCEKLGAQASAHCVNSGRFRVNQTGRERVGGPS